MVAAIFNVITIVNAYILSLDPAGILALTLTVTLISLQFSDADKA